MTKISANMDHMLSFDTRVSRISRQDQGLVIDIATQYTSEQFVIPLDDLFEEAEEVKVNNDYDIEASWRNKTMTISVPEYLKPNHARKKR